MNFELTGENLECLVLVPVSMKGKRHSGSMRRLELPVSPFVLGRKDFDHTRLAK